MIFFYIIRMYIYHIICYIMCDVWALLYYADERISAIRKCFSWIWIFSDRAPADRLPGKYTPVYTYVYTYGPELRWFYAGWLAENENKNFSFRFWFHRAVIWITKLTFRHRYKATGFADQINLIWYIGFETRWKVPHEFRTAKSYRRKTIFLWTLSAKLYIIYPSSSSIRFEDIFPFFSGPLIIVFKYNTTQSWVIGRHSRSLLAPVRVFFPRLNGI